MDMNKICATPKYKCGVCGEIYDSIAQRMNCEQTCLKKQEEEERKAAEEKKIAEYNTRVEEVRDAFKKAYTLRDQLEADYANLQSNNYNYLNDLVKIIFDF